MTSILAFSKPVSIGLVSGERSSGRVEMPLSALTRRMRQGDDAAWREFHGRYYLALLRYAASCLGARNDAADVVQHAYLRVGRHIKEFRDEDSFWRWLACVVRCAAIDYRRGLRRRTILLEKFAHWNETQNTSPLPSREFTATSALATDALEQLAPEDTNLLRLKYYEGWTVEEIAAQAGGTPKAIENRLARLRQRLREMIARMP